MRTTTSISAFRHEQPAPEVWDAVERLLTTWERSGGTVGRPADFIRQVEVPDPAESASLVARLEELGAALHVVRRDLLEPEDYRQADYVGIFGVDLGPDLVRNEDEVVVDTGPCPECGQHDVLDVEQTGTFTVDGSALAQPAVDGSRPGRQGWEVVGLPGGGLAVSPSLADWFGGISGAELRELVDLEGRSSRMVQVVADRTVLVPCRTHTVVDGPTHCTSCGRARGDVHGHTWVSAAQTGGREVFSRHRGGRAFLVLARSALDVLEERRPAGLELHGVLRVCEHDTA